MRKKVVGKKLSRDTDSRRALIRSLLRAIVLNGKIKTTKAKSKILQREIDKIMNIVAKDTIFSRRQVLARVANDRQVVTRLFKNLLPLAKSRKSGFTTLANLAPRKGDMAKMVRVEWVEKPTEEKKNEKNIPTKR